MTHPASNPSSAMSQEPLPCAFCGAANPTVFQNAVVCKACSASGPDLGHTRDKPGAVAAWNHRAALLSLQRKNEELVRAITEIKDFPIGDVYKNQIAANMAIFARQALRSISEEK